MSYPPITRSRLGPPARFLSSNLRWLALAAALCTIGATPARTQSVVETWGYNQYGQLGNGTTVDTSAPLPLATLSGNVTAVSGGYSHSVAVQNGALFAWGYNAYGELGNGTTTDSRTPVAVPGMSSGVTAVSAGPYTTLAVQNGVLYGWGMNGNSQTGNGTSNTTLSPSPAVVLTSGVTAVSSAFNHSLAIRNGAVYSWGNGPHGELGLGSSTLGVLTPTAISSLSSGVTAISAGTQNGLAIRNGAVYSWGSNVSGQVGDGTAVNRFAPVALSLSSGVTAIASGDAHDLAVQNGHVYAWGNNFYGQLGNGTTTSSSVPIEIDAVDLKNIVAVATGQSSSFALSADGSLWVWGDNYYGQLGLGTTGGTYQSRDYLTPQHLLPPSGFVYTGINSIGDHAVGILSAVPEPSTWAMLLGGAGLLGWTLRRQRRSCQE